MRDFTEHENLTEEQIEQLKDKRKTVKYGSDSKPIVIDKDDNLEHEGKRRKYRHKPTNITAKKKKRKNQK